MENFSEKKENTILIVDDEKINRLNLRKILGDTYEILEAEDGKEAIDILEKNIDAVSAIILDLIMPNFNGYQFMKEYSQSKTFGAIPVVIATVAGDVATEKECLELGAWDFVGKPYDPSIIRFRVKNVIDRSQNQISKELRYRTQYSDIAPIYNMSMFYYVTNKMLDRYPDKNFAFIRMDIERFRLVNVLFGREEGNKLLFHVADSLRGLEESGTVAYGHNSADVFCIFMAYESVEEIHAFMKKMNARVADYSLDFDVVLTYGIYLNEHEKLSVGEMYERALSASKNCKGVYIRNYAFFENKMRETLVKEQTIVNKMQNALKNDEFVLYIQPKYELSKNSLSGGEVLVRWIDPEVGMISPGDFIPVFEENGFIMKLDFYIWEKACQLVRKWLDEGRSPHPISVNLSRVSLYNSQLTNILCEIVDKYQVPPYYLQIELTESAYTNNQDAIKNIMLTLQKKGFTILMDDFGSGYSSLNVLKDVEVDVLKIDMKFMSHTEKETRSENILAAVVRMAKWLNLPVIAEGVEKKEQVQFLKSIGCEYVQGYYFARPMPVEEYEKLEFSGDGLFIEKQESDKSIDAIWSTTSQLEMVFNNMMQAVAVYEYSDGEIEVLRVNNAYYDMFGFSGMDDVKCGLECSLSHESHQDFIKAFEEVVRTQDVSECEVLRQIGSQQFWIRVSLKYMNKVGSKHVIYGFITDVTSQREMAVELQKYREVVKPEQTIQETMLIVDDSEINRASLCSIFESKYRILEAENGKDALRVLEKEDYRVDIILLDLVMPEMDGMEFLDCKKDMAAIANIPTVIITADDSPEQQSDIMRMGANEYIVKPFIPEIVTTRIENVLDSARSFRRMLHTSSENLGGGI